MSAVADEDKRYTTLEVAALVATAADLEQENERLNDLVAGNLEAHEEKKVFLQMKCKGLQEENERLDAVIRYLEGVADALSDPSAKAQIAAALAVHANGFAYSRVPGVPKRCECDACKLLRRPR